MPVLPAVGRRSLRMRLFVWSMYLVLTVGAVTMVYPFVLMLSNSFTSQYDNVEFEVFPDYLTNDSVLFAKFIYEKTGLVALAREYGLTGDDPLLDGWVIDDESGKVLLGPEVSGSSVVAATKDAAIDAEASGAAIGAAGSGAALAGATPETSVAVPGLETAGPSAETETAGPAATYDAAIDAEAPAAAVGAATPGTLADAVASEDPSDAATQGAARDGTLIVIHSMPDVSAVDVYLGERRIVEGLKYRTAVTVPLTPEVRSGTAVSVRVAGTETPIGRTVSVSFAPGSRAVVAVSGSPSDSWTPGVLSLASGAGGPAAGNPADATGASVRLVSLVDPSPGVRVAFAEIEGGTETGDEVAKDPVEVRNPQGETKVETRIPDGRCSVTLGARGAEFSVLEASGETVFRKGKEYTIIVAGRDDHEWVVRTDIAPPEPLTSWLRGAPGAPTVEQAKVLVEELNRFRKEVPDLWRYSYFQELFNRIDTYVMFQKWLQTQVSFEEVRDKWGKPVTGWNVLYPPGEDPERHRFWPEDDQITHAWTKFKRDILPVQYVRVLMLDSVYRYYLDHTPLQPDGDENIRTAADYNGLFGTRYPRITDVRFPSSRPAGGRARDLYDGFLREWCPAVMTRLRAPAEAYRSYLEHRYRTVEEYNNAHETPPISGFDGINVPIDAPETKVARADWQDFMSAKDESGNYLCDVDWIEARSPECEFQDRLRKRFGTIADLNAACGTYYASFEEVSLPAPISDMVYFLDHRSEIRKRFFTDNYTEVWNYIAGHGRAALNTLILVVATIFTALTVNPMAAYALSRFRLKATNKILLFLLATMAFPAEVGMIPSFLLLKNFHLLNTYWALILPGVAGGFAIFLLKGFFDSLPPELYEAAIIDGAGEWTMFWRVTLPLCKPILAVMALGAFGGAYGAFMFAFLVCQKPSMWTLMVFLYQLQQSAPQHVVMASLVIASIPTLLVFIFCQNIILRGIIIPSFK